MVGAVVVLSGCVTSAGAVVDAEDSGAVVSSCAGVLSGVVGDVGSSADGSTVMVLFGAAVSFCVALPMEIVSPDSVSAASGIRFWTSPQIGSSFTVTASVVLSVRVKLPSSMLAV